MSAVKHDTYRYIPQVPSAHTNPKTACFKCQVFEQLAVEDQAACHVAAEPDRGKVRIQEHAAQLSCKQHFQMEEKGGVY